jgi:hypothetical protein
MERLAVSLKTALAVILAGSFTSFAVPASAMPGVSARVTVSAGPTDVQPVYWVWIHHHRYWRHHHFHHWHR